MWMSRPGPKKLREDLRVNAASSAQQKEHPATFRALSSKYLVAWQSRGVHIQRPMQGNLPLFLTNLRQIVCAVRHV
jgi:hypothetical protein